MFKRKSLASIVANFNRMIADLEDLQGLHGSTIDNHQIEIARLRAARDNLVAERQQAETIAVNLRSLLGLAA